MRGSQRLMAILLPLVAGASLGQEPACNPCVDGPEMIDGARVPTIPGEGRGGKRLVVVPEIPAAGPGRIAALIRAQGGKLSDMTHDCGNVIRETFGGTDWMVSACSWGGRYPALLIKPAVGNPTESVFVMAATGVDAYELLTEEHVPSAAAGDLRALSVEGINALFEKANSTPRR